VLRNAATAEKRRVAHQVSCCGTRQQRRSVTTRIKFRVAERGNSGEASNKSLLQFRCLFVFRIRLSTIFRYKGCFCAVCLLSSLAPLLLSRILSVSAASAKSSSAASILAIAPKLRRNLLASTIRGFNLCTASLFAVQLEIVKVATAMLPTLPVCLAINATNRNEAECVAGLRSIVNGTSVVSR
jgi:hypothetical protein